MQVKMVGIDHNKASLQDREKFSFTGEEAVCAMQQVRKMDGITGCILLSTCNRTELWISQSDSSAPDPAEILCGLKGGRTEAYRGFFTVREGKAAIEHLMVTACGINSKIFGEDQIITQVVDALELARSAKTTGKTLEKVFLNSIAAAKQVKTSVKLTGYNPSVADSGVRELREAYGSLEGKTCLIIGNGKMAALIAGHLLDSGAKVMMTLRRQYHHGEEFSSLAPAGCQMIGYEERYEKISMADVVVSATLSPHYTITREGLAASGAQVKPGSLWLDLAVPRDIEPSVASAYGIRLCDVDHLDSEVDTDLVESGIAEAKQIIGAYRQEIVNWLAFRKQVPKVRETVKAVEEDCLLRADREIKQLGFDEATVSKVEEIVESAAGRAVNKLIFGLKDTLEPEQWERCVDALLQSAKKDTIKS